MTQNELTRLLQEHWMSMPEEERFVTCGGLYEAEKAILESLAPTSYSLLELREFVFYHMHGYKIPEEARQMMEARGKDTGRS
jgi:hypothetical protein